MKILSASVVTRLVALTLVGHLAACRREAATDVEDRAPALTSPPHLVLEPASHDFGKVLEGIRLSYVFTVKNTGGRRLEIASVRPSCGCTAAVLTEKIVPPGGTTRIEVSFDTLGRRGKNHKTVSVNSNDPVAATTQLEFFADVETRLGFEPPRIHLQVAHGEARTVETWLTGQLAGRAGLEVAPDAASGLALKVIHRSSPAGRQTGLAVTLTAKDVGQAHGTVEAKTGLPELPSIELPYDYQIHGNLSVPIQVFVDPSRPNLARRTLLVRSTRQDLKVVGVPVTAGPFVAKILGPAAHGGVEIEVTASAPPARGGNVHGELVIVSNDPLEPRKSVRLVLAEAKAGDSGAPAATSSHRTE